MLDLPKEVFKATHKLQKPLKFMVSTLIVVMLVFHKESVTYGTIMRQKNEGKKVSLSKLFDFTTVLIRAEIRGQARDCLLCKIGRLQMNEKGPLKQSSSGGKE